eukprot:RCo045185
MASFKGRGKADDGLLSESEFIRKLEASSSATHFEGSVNSALYQVGRLGVKLPRLLSCKLNNSVILSIRDLGSGLRRLRVLWLNRCGISDLDGISAIPGLQELYCAFNDISELSPLGALPSLEVLDLECNKVSSVGELDNLARCPVLSTLTLEGNPLSELPDYRKQLSDRIPSVQFLDDLPMLGANPALDDVAKDLEALGQDWESIRSDLAIVNRSLKAGCSGAGAEPAGSALDPSVTGSLPFSDSEGSPSAEATPTVFCGSVSKCLLSSRKPSGPREVPPGL